jgi:hypothetical protein
MSDEEEDSLVIRSFAISPKRIFAFEIKSPAAIQMTRDYSISLFSC